MLLCGGITASHPIGVVVFCDSSTAHFMGLPGLKFKCNWWWTSKLGALDRFLPHFSGRLWHPANLFSRLCRGDSFNLFWLLTQWIQQPMQIFIVTLVDLVNSQPLMCDFNIFQRSKTGLARWIRHPKFAVPRFSAASVGSGSGSRRSSERKIHRSRRSGALNAEGKQSKPPSGSG